MIEERIAIIDGCLYNEETGEVCISAKFGQKIVRCKDCDCRGEWRCPMYHDDWDWDMTEDDGFCHVGKRR